MTHLRNGLVLDCHTVRFRIVRNSKSGIGDSGADLWKFMGWLTCNYTLAWETDNE